MRRSALLDEGECLVDNIEVDYNGDQLCFQFGTFESGTNSWSLQGCMIAFQPGKQRLSQQPFTAHPRQRPDLDG